MPVPVHTLGSQFGWIFNDGFQVGQKILTGIELSVRDTRSPFFVDLAFPGLPLWCPEPRLVRIDGVDLGHGPTATGQDHDLSTTFDGRDLFRSKDKLAPGLGW